MHQQGPPDQGGTSTKAPARQAKVLEATFLRRYMSDPLLISLLVPLCRLVIVPRQVLDVNADFRPGGQNDSHQAPRVVNSTSTMVASSLEGVPPRWAATDEQIFCVASLADWLRQLTNTSASRSRPKSSP